MSAIQVSVLLNGRFDYVKVSIVVDICSLDDAIRYKYISVYIRDYIPNFEKSQAIYRIVNLTRTTHNCAGARG